MSWKSPRTMCSKFRMNLELVLSIWPFPLKNHNQVSFHPFVLQETWHLCPHFHKIIFALIITFYEYFSTMSCKNKVQGKTDHKDNLSWRFDVKFACPHILHGAQITKDDVSPWYWTPPRYSWYPYIYYDIPHGTEHTLYRVFSRV